MPWKLNDGIRLIAFALVALAWITGAFPQIVNADDLNYDLIGSAPSALLALAPLPETASTLPTRQPLADSLFSFTEPPRTAPVVYTTTSAGRSATGLNYQARLGGRVFRFFGGGLRRLLPRNWGSGGC